MLYQTYLKIWDRSGLIPGPVSMPSREGSHRVLEGAHGVQGALLNQRHRGRDSAGLRYHKPLKLSMELNASAPRLLQCLCRLAPLAKVEIDFWHLVESGKEERYFHLLLDGAVMVHATTHLPDTRGINTVQEPILLKLGFVYEKITWLSELGYIFFSDPKDEGEDEVEEKSEATQAYASLGAEGEEADKVLLTNPLWATPEAGFNEETEVSVAISLPQSAQGRKKVMFELFARRPSQHSTKERITQVEGYADVEVGEGKAICRVPLFRPGFLKPDEQDEQVEYFFIAKHSLSNPLESAKEPTGVKLVERQAEALIDTHIMDGVTFGFDSSFLHPDQLPKLKALGEKVRAWKETHPEGKLALFGHTDAIGKEAYNKGLSERRARSVYAYLMREPEVWEALHQEEKWGLHATQTLFKHLGHDPGAIDGKDGPKTQGAVKAFQEKADLSADGVAGPKTREALFQAFLKECPSLELKAKDFDTVDGQPFMGCSEFNLVEKTQGECEANRRVTALLLKSSKTFPIQYPCKRGDLGPCQGQVKKPGERRTEGFGCKFYDKVVVEKEAENKVEESWELSVVYPDSSPALGSVISLHFTDGSKRVLTKCFEKPIRVVTGGTSLNSVSIEINGMIFKEKIESNGNQLKGKCFIVLPELFGRALIFVADESGRAQAGVSVQLFSMNTE